MSETKKKPMNEAERAALVQKLDDDLEEFMESLATKKKDEGPKDPFNFDKFMEELDQHPMFMKDLKSDKSGKYSEHIEALQAMKYDEDDEYNAKDKAEDAKKEGNKHFQFKKYRWAIEAYTNGIKALCVDNELNSQLYGNRAAAHKYLGNHGSAVKDCIFSWKFNPRNLKAALRGAECLLELGYAGRCLNFIDRVQKKLDEVEKQESLLDVEKRREFEDNINVVKEKAEQKRSLEERNERRKAAEEKKNEQEKRDLLKKFKERRIRFSPMIDVDSLEHFDLNEICIRSPYTKELLQERVYIDKETDGLMWPVLLQYVGAAQTDMIKDSHEELVLEELLTPAFAEPAPWDNENWDYRKDNVRVFVPLDIFEDQQLLEIDLQKTLREMISHKDHTVIQGLPIIQIYTKKNAEKNLECLGNNLFRPL